MKKIQKKKPHPNRAFFDKETSRPAVLARSISSYRSRLSRTINNILLFLFIFLLPTQLGKHFFFDFSYLSGVRVDYLAPTIYLTDLIVILLALVNFKVIVGMFKNKAFLFFLLVLVVNLLFSLSKPVTLYRDFKLIELLILWSVMKYSAISIKKILLACALSVSVEAMLVIFQFIEKGSLEGIFYFLGERYITLSTPGAAKAAIQGVEILRPYGTFSHPNSMGGFYLLLYFFILTVLKSKPYFWLKNIFLFLSTLVIFFSFSKLAIGVFIVLNLIYFFKQANLKRCKMCLASRIIVLLVLALIFFQAQGDPLSLKNRINLIQNSFQIINRHLLFGVGLGNYLIAQDSLRTFSLSTLNQPVHMIPLLAPAEFGFIALIILFTLLLQIIKPIIKKCVFLVLLIIATSLFDHYWYTLQQNLLLLGVIGGLSIRMLSKSSRAVF